MKKISEFFSDDICNFGRQAEIDLAKAIPVLSLPFIHTVIECASSDSLNYGLPFIFDCFVGGPMSAPVYMFSMGLVLNYARQKGPKAMRRKALHLFLVGFLLNICRFLIPYLTGFALTGDVQHFLVPLPYKVFGNDVLQFAPLALVLLSFLQEKGFSDRKILSLAVLMSLVGWTLNDIDFHNPVLNVLLGHVMGTVDEAELVISDFPILNWFIFPAAGMIFGKAHRRLKDKAGFYRMVSPVCLAIVCIYYPLAMHYEWGMFGSGENAYYHLQFYEMPTFFCDIFALLGIYYLMTRVMPEKMMSFFRSISMGITEFYCVHWVLVIVITNVILYIINGTQELPVPETLLLSLAITVVTSVVVLTNQKLKERMRNTK
ncbi:MAG: acyltransferase family protein [Solobacterium sp.]|nr:acyltransferase family protein [Solobacterium sp.]